MFPDGVPLPLSRIIQALERVEFTTTHVEGLQTRLREDDHATGPSGSTRTGTTPCGSPGIERARIWRLYLRAARQGFETGWASVYQVLAHRRRARVGPSRFAASARGAARKVEYGRVCPANLEGRGMSRTVPVRLNVNGVEHHLEVEPRLLLVHAIRDHLGLTGTHVGCDTSNCGACTIHMDGKPVKSCTVLAVQADGAALTTIEGMATENELHPLQEAFWNDHGLQCGYCTPGMIMAAAGLLAENPNPTEEEVRHGLEGNLCRCTGYHNIVKAVLDAAKVKGASVSQESGVSS